MLILDPHHAMQCGPSNSATDREETLRRLREDLRSPPTALPPLLRRCRAGLGIKLVFSAREWGKMESLDLRLLAGDINVQVGLL